MPILTGSPVGGSAADVSAGASVSAGAVVSSGAAVVSAGASASVVAASSPSSSPHAAKSIVATVNTANALVRFVVDMRDPPLHRPTSEAQTAAITAPAPDNLVTARRTSVRTTTHYRAAVPDSAEMDATGGDRMERNTELERVAEIFIGDWSLTVTNQWWLDDPATVTYGTATCDWLGRLVRQAPGRDRRQTDMGLRLRTQ